MHKIDGPGNVNGGFVSEDVATGRVPTLVTPEWLNAVQEELTTIVEAAGLELTAGNNQQVLQSLRVLFGDNVGQITFFALSAPPPGWLVADGSELLRADYPRLWARVQSHGAITFDLGSRELYPGAFYNGDGVNTFCLPDLRGVFLRAFDAGRGFDPGRAVGTLQADEIRSHTHTPAGQTGLSSPVTQNGVKALGGSFYDGLENVGYTGGLETRPVNVALLACIKY